MSNLPTSFSILRYEHLPCYCKCFVKYVVICKHQKLALPWYLKERIQDEKEEEVEEEEEEEEEVEVVKEEEKDKKRREMSKAKFTPRLQSHELL
ncbi:hypothetical protein HZH68_003132 [Vespula germanica]|uniref:Uncharacterized protein n=1 Tax=Vespula germanica TaxID=30212 RepID=A0A834U2Y3_VESGE|nr:hypothetical protein HZH68_003132 [Vespula germanica]